jgi:preprotein translocase subunit SecG
MENVVLTIHLLLALSLIGVVLLQRSEGGGLGLGGGGGGGGGVMSGRSAASALSKVTWILAIGFIITSISLTMIAANNSTGASVVDRLTGTAPTADGVTPSLPDVELALPPTEEDAAPLVPSAD